MFALFTVAVVDLRGAGLKGGFFDPGVIDDLYHGRSFWLQKSISNTGKIVVTGKVKVEFLPSLKQEAALFIFDLQSGTFTRSALNPEPKAGGSANSAAEGISSIAPIQVPPDASSSGLNLSRDGSTVVGYIDNGFFTPFHAFRWSEATGIVDLGTLVPADNANHSSFGTDASDDGSVVVGYSTLAGDNFPENAFRWTEAGGMVALGSGLPTDGNSRAYGVSGDGSVVVGRADFPPPPGGFSNVRQPFRWTESGGMASLGGLEATSRGTARAVSADGSVIIGESTVTVTINNAQTGRDRAFRWTAAGGMQNLGVLPGFEASTAVAVSDDGSVVIGICNPSVFGEEAGGVVSYDNKNARAFYWTEAGGMRDLTQLLVDAGADVSRPLVGVTGMTGDASWIAAVSSRPDAEFPEFITDPFPVLISLTETLPPPSRLLNLSTRGETLTGDSVLIPGFVVRGETEKKVLIRAVGPELAGFGVASPLADPVLELKQDGATLSSNDDWGAQQGPTTAADIVAATIDVGGFPLTDGSKSAALLVTLAPGTYTVPVTGKGGTTGNVIVEAYDADAATPRLINVSTRGFVGVGDAIMIPGFVVSPESSGRLLVRAVGPTLGSFGVQNVLANPQLKIFRQEPDGSSTEIFANDDWGSPSSAPGLVYATEDAGAFPLDGGSRDAAIVVQLLPGAYTVQVSGVGGGTGNALVEVYELP